MAISINSIRSSEFKMWRTLISLAHSDGVLHQNELGYFSDVFKNLKVSPEQLETLNLDLESPKDIFKMYSTINNPKDRAKFFYLSRILCWIDGDYSKEEVAIVEKLQELHLDYLSSKEMDANLEKSVFRSFQKESAEHSKKNIPVDQVLKVASDYWESNEGVKKAA